MASLINTVDTAHHDMVHDAQTDFYGTRLATCSSDKSVKVFDIKNGTQKLLAVLTGHEGPVWQVAWAHPSFGSLLASCSYDRTVCVWADQGTGGGGWQRVYEYRDHDSSVNSICWAPHEFGLMLACASSDGAVSVLSSSGDGVWVAKKISNAHTIGCNAVSWAPAQGPDQAGEPGVWTGVRQFATGGCDNLVKIWRLQEPGGNGEWQEAHQLEAHSDWVRDVAWSPAAGQPGRIASCSQDCRVILWTYQGGGGGSWLPQLLGTFDDVVWLISWSLTGSVLAASGGDNNVTLWKESRDGTWTCISETNHEDDDGSEKDDV